MDVIKPQTHVTSQITTEQKTDSWLSSVNAATGEEKPVETLFRIDEGYVALLPCICASDANRERARKGQIALCRDMPWRCEREVLPTSNTGVHAAKKTGDEFEVSPCLPIE